MKILFGESIDGDYTDMFTDPGLPGAYYYQVSMEYVDTVVIEDTCGRMVPFDFESIPALILALQTLERKVGTLIKCKNSVDEQLMELQIAS